MFNNTDMPGLLTGIQSTSLGIKMFLILNFCIEISLVTYKIVLDRRMRKLKIKGHEKVTEEERRNKYSRKIFLGFLISFVTWLIVFIVCLAVSEGRKCDERHAMEFGVCVPCKDPDCTKCEEDADIC